MAAKANTDAAMLPKNGNMLIPAPTAATNIAMTNWDAPSRPCAPMAFEFFNLLKPMISMIKAAIKPMAANQPVKGNRSTNEATSPMIAAVRINCSPCVPTFVQGGL